MKKLLIIMILCLGFCSGTWAQNAKADYFARELTVALDNWLSSRSNMSDYTAECERIGIELGDYLKTMEIEAIEPFLEEFLKRIYHNFADFGLPKEHADMVVNSFKDAFYAAFVGEETEDEGTFTGTVSEAADYYSKLFSSLTEDAFNGEQDQAEAEKVGYELGVYLAGLPTDDVKTFQKEFYSLLAVHLSRIPAFAELTSEEMAELIDIFRMEYDKIF